MGVELSIGKELEKKKVVQTICSAKELGIRNCLKEWWMMNPLGSFFHSWFIAYLSWKVGTSNKANQD